VPEGGHLARKLVGGERDRLPVKAVAGERKYIGLRAPGQNEDERLVRAEQRAMLSRPAG
jgi:hypothetical protein